MDAVVNFAAESHVDRSILDPDAFLRTGVQGVYVLLEAVRELKIPRLLHISTDEVYGSIAEGSADEDAPLRPTSPYSSAKASGDLLALAYFHTHATPVVITRSSNNFGPYQYPEKVIPLFVTNALDDEPLPLYGDGKNVRDWLYVLDNCEAIDLVLRRGRDGEVYNIGGGHEAVIAHPARERPARPRPPLLGGLCEAAHARMGAAPRVHRRPRRDRRVVSTPRSVVAAAEVGRVTRLLRATVRRSHLTTVGRQDQMEAA